jgi:hypothetical protein
MDNTFLDILKESVCTTCNPAMRYHTCILKYPDDFNEKLCKLNDEECSILNHECEYFSCFREKECLKVFGAGFELGVECTKEMNRRHGG